MAGRNGGDSPLKRLAGAIASGVLICMLLIIGIAGGGLDTLSRSMGGPALGRDISVLFGHPEGAPEGGFDLTGLLSGGTSLANPRPTAIPRPATPKPTAGKTDGSGRQKANPAYAKALAQAKAIRVAAPRPDGYDRLAAFGGWADRPDRGARATTRDLILSRDLRNTTVNRYGQVTSGTLADPYTGRTIAFKRGITTSAAVQIDHVVALQDAWASGASRWSRAKRVAYANDPAVLLAVDGPANERKGAGVDFTGGHRFASQRSGLPDVWMPSSKAYRCDYLTARVTIKTRYGLTMGPTEKTQTVEALNGCVAGK